MRATYCALKGVQDGTAHAHHSTDVSGVFLGYLRVNEGTKLLAAVLTFVPRTSRLTTLPYCYMYVPVPTCRCIIYYVVITLHLDDGIDKRAAHLARPSV